MSLDKLRVGFVAVARTTFDVELADATARAARAALCAAGLEVIGVERLVTDHELLDLSARELSGETLDLLIAFQATFADSTFAVRLAEAADFPLLLWAVPEARTGERLRLNSPAASTWLATR